MNYSRSSEILLFYKMMNSLTYLRFWNMILSKLSSSWQTSVKLMYRTLGHALQNVLIPTS